MKTILISVAMAVISAGAFAGSESVSLGCRPLLTQNNVEMNEISFGVKCFQAKTAQGYKCSLTYTYQTESEQAGEIELLSVKSDQSNVVKFKTPDGKVKIEMTSDLQMASIDFIKTLSTTCAQDLSNNSIR